LSHSVGLLQIPKHDERKGKNGSHVGGGAELKVYGLGRLDETAFSFSTSKHRNKKEPDETGEVRNVASAALINK
jgi:hypothetical protein